MLENFFKINLSMVNSKTIQKKISNLLFENSTIYLDNINEKFRKKYKWKIGNIRNKNLIWKIIPG